jgi:hypothetical protein
MSDQGNRQEPFTAAAGTSGESSTAQTAKDEAGNVAQTAAQSGGQVASTARDQGQRVLAEAGEQARNLVEETRSQLGEQAGAQQERAAGGLRSLAEELQSMASSSDQSGMASRLVHQASDQLQQVAGWLDQRDPQALLQEARGFARRRPGAFLLGAAAAGMLAGRMTRAGVDMNRSEQSPTATGYPTQQPATPYPTDYGYSTAGQGATGDYTAANYAAGTGTGYPTEPGAAGVEPTAVAPLVPPATEDPTGAYPGGSRTDDPLADPEERRR